MLTREKNNPRRYNDFQTSFRKLFYGEKVQKISVDGGFSCPNRDGKRGTGGCTYCNNASFSPVFAERAGSIREQIEKGKSFFSHKYQGMKFLAYFQSFSNTYAQIEILQKMYEEALETPEVVGLVIATRPDCLGNEVLDYLAEIAKDHYLMLELGLESHLDKTLKLINRGHTYAESVYALEEASKRNLHTTAHLILGLPGERREDWIDQARVISQLPVENLKLHQLQIHRGTVMAQEYMKNPGSFTLFTAEEYISLVVDYLELLNPRITVERFTSQAPADWVIAPSWGLKNYEFTAKVEKMLAQRDTWQGKKS